MPLYLLCLQLRHGALRPFGCSFIQKPGAGAGAGAAEAEEGGTRGAAEAEGAGGHRILPHGIRIRRQDPLELQPERHAAGGAGSGNLRPESRRPDQAAGVRRWRPCIPNSRHVRLLLHDWRIAECGLNADGLLLRGNHLPVYLDVSRGGPARVERLCREVALQEPRGQGIRVELYASSCGWLCGRARLAVTRPHRCQRNGAQDVQIQGQSRRLVHGGRAEARQPCLGVGLGRHLGLDLRPG
mmetsp:Transcript_100966/g.260953  ORF Transcript_100966/g.260953 Transcript_100966/m.260953 type:complete len:241 (-) Transcript_100966:318-1040(-)